MSYKLAEIISTEIKGKNPTDLRRELKEVYRQIVPYSHGERALGRYTGCEQTFREKERLVNSFARLLIDLGLTKESDKVMRYFYGEDKQIAVRKPLSKEGKDKLIQYIHSALFGEIFFQNRYGIRPLKQQV